MAIFPWLTSFTVLSVLYVACYVIVVYTCGYAVELQPLSITAPQAVNSHAGPMFVVIVCFFWLFLFLLFIFWDRCDVNEGWVVFIALIGVVLLQWWVQYSLCRC